MHIRFPRRPQALITLAALLLSTGSLVAHELFLKLDTYFLPAEAPVRVAVLNGTFDKSESTVARDRVAALSLAGPAGSRPLDTTALTARNDTSFVTLRTGPAGTYVLGLSVRPRDVEYTGEQFTTYLKAEGYEDVLAERTRAGTLGESGRRRYSTHVKAIVQVGSARSATHATVLGYAAEIIPIDNPYGLKRGDTFRLRCLLDGKPAAGLTVQAGGETPQGAPRTEALLRTDSDGVVRVPLDSAGRWYIKFAKMRPSAAPGLNYESERATLTFEVR